MMNPEDFAEIAHERDGCRRFALRADRDIAEITYYDVRHDVIARELIREARGFWSWVRPQRIPPDCVEFDLRPIGGVADKDIEAMREKGWLARQA